LVIVLAGQKPKGDQHFAGQGVQFMPLHVIQQITIQLDPRWTAVFEMLKLAPIFDFHICQKKAQVETLILADVGGLVGTSRVPAWACLKIPAKG
jgi:hypothetical protein